MAQSRSFEILETAVIVYADRKRRVRTTFPRTNLRDALIRFGEVEAAIADTLCPHRDEPHPLLEQLRAAALRLAHGDLTVLDNLPKLPAEVCVSVPEGYAYYGLYPEDYAKAARRFVHDARPQAAIVIGIRSIGTSLSAVVAATLEEAGCKVRSFTVRPHGHPFDRRLSIGDFQLDRASHFLVVDEGPGLSGSSFAAVARALGELGVPDDRITLFPGWDADGSTFLSGTARQQWIRHRRYSESRDSFPGWRDLSAGKWRAVCSISVPVQPQHERLKYLRDGILLKFEGLAGYGEARFARARQLHDAGFTTRPLTLDDGYLASEFVPGQPVRMATPDLIAWIQRYLHFLQNTFPSDRPVPFEQNLEMMRVNVREALGPEWANRLDKLAHFRSVVCDASTVQIDGRMLPHEFLRTANGYVKLDALDHHDDHFFPGCQDIAWDVAGVSVEFGVADLTTPDLSARLPFYLLAYLSYRLGYCLMAAQSGSDSAGFQSVADRYIDKLRYAISRVC